MRNYCSKCGTRITTHLWIVGGKVFCGVSCQRGGKSLFEKTRRALDKMKRERDG